MSGGGRPPEPPRLARLLARFGVAADDRASALADLAERYAVLSEERGPRSARRWYWWQAVRGVAHRLRPDLELVRRGSWSGVWGDARQKARSLGRRPVYAVGVVGTLAIGLASAALVGTLAWTVWLSPMPFPDPDRVVRLYEVEPLDAGAPPGTERVRWRLSPPLLEELRAHEWTTVSAVSGVGRNVADWDREGELTRITALAVSPELFEIAGIRPLHGTLLRDDPDAREVVLTEELWRRAFGGDSTVVGRASMVLDGEPHRIVGVASVPSAYPGAGDLLVPLTWSEEQLASGMRGARYLDVVARVRPDFGVNEASEEMDRLVVAAARDHANHEGWGGEAVVLGDELVSPYRGILAMLLAAGVSFLLLAVVNVAGLVTARSVDGRADRDIRMAVGASEGRLLREALVEGGLVAGLAALLALALTRWLLPPIKALVPAEVPRVDEVALSMGGGVAIVAAALAAGCVIAGVAHFVSRSVPGRRPSRTARPEEGLGRNAIVASQVALTTLLVTAGVAILTTSVRLQRVDLGFEPAGVASTQVMLTGERYPNVEARLVFWRGLLEELEGRGFTAAVGTSPAMAGVNMPWGYRVDATDDQSFAQYHIVSPDYFSVMGLEVLHGRSFVDTDHEDAPPVIVVNDVLARQEFGDDPAVGRRIQVVAEEKTIVGVVEGARHFGPDQDVPPEIYAPFTQDPWPHAQILLPGAPETLAGPVAAAADAVDPGLGLAPVEPYRRFVAEWYAGLNLQLIIVGVLAAVGMLLATLGLYALIAYRVSTRRREIGVRLALGAAGRSVFGQVAGQGMAVAAVGLVVGLGTWYGVAPLADRWLGDVPVHDPWAPVVVTVLVGLTSALAAAIPALRSLGVDPARALREE